MVTETHPRAVAFANRKGGVGKTALSINAADRLADRGHDVLLVDADPAGHATEGAGLRETFEADGHLGEFLYGEDGVGFTDVIYETEYFDVAPSNAELGKYQNMIDSEDPMAVQCIQQKLVEPLLGDVYDFIVIDSPASHGTLFSDATLVGARNVVVPLVPGEESIRGFETMLDGQISKIREHMDLKILALVPNMCRNDNELVRLIEQMNEYFPEYVPRFATAEMLDTSPGPGIRERIDFKRAWREGVPLSAYNPESDMLDRLDVLAEIVERGGTADE